MNDTNSLIIAIIFVLVLAGWWFYNLAQMRRETDNLRTVFKNDKFTPYKPSKKARFAYDTYNSVVAFIRRHINLDNRADDDGVD